MQLWLCRRQWPSDLSAGRLRWWDVLGWQEVPSPSGSPPGHTNGVGAIPNKVAWGMPESPLSPLSRFPFRRGWPHTPPADGYADEDDSLGPPSLEGWHPSGHGSKGFQKRWMGSHNTFCTWGWAYNAPSGGGWWLCPHFGPPSHINGSGSPHWSGIVHLDHVCQSGPLPWGTLMGVLL